MTTTPFGGPAPVPAAQPFGAPAAPQPQAQPFGAPAAPQQQPAAPGAAPWGVPSETANSELLPTAVLNGQLLLITPREYKQNVTTQHGVKDLVVADVAVIGGHRDGAGNWSVCPPEQSTLLESQAVFGGFLIAALKGKVNAGMVLGRLYQGVATKGNPPWMLSDPTPQDQAAAMAYYNASAAAQPPF